MLMLFLLVYITILEPVHDPSLCFALKTIFLVLQEASAVIVA